MSRAAQRAQWSTLSSSEYACKFLSLRNLSQFDHAMGNGRGIETKMNRTICFGSIAKASLIRVSPPNTSPTVTELLIYYRSQIKLFLFSGREFIPLQDPSRLKYTMSVDQSIVGEVLYNASWPSIPSSLPAAFSTAVLPLHVC